MNHTICHFDISADDPERLKEFYEKLFGWKITKTEGPVDYWLIETGGVGGGIAKREKPEDSITNFVCVESVDEYSKKIEDLGGKVIMPKHTVPGYGFMTVFVDPQGNKLGIWEDDKEAK